MTLWIDDWPSENGWVHSIDTGHLLICVLVLKLFFSLQNLLHPSIHLYDRDAMTATTLEVVSRFVKWQRFVCDLHHRTLEVAGCSQLTHAGFQALTKVTCHHQSPYCDSQLLISIVPSTPVCLMLVWPNIQR